MGRPIFVAGIIWQWSTTRSAAVLGLQQKMSAEGKKKIATAAATTTICFEGNIGSGKTTLLRYFDQTAKVKTFSEPVNTWRNVGGGGHNLLQLMYSNPARYSCMFQSYVQLTMMDIHTVSIDKPVKMMERSIYSSRYCFVENLYRRQLMCDAEYAVLDQWFQWIITNFNVKPDLIVYLRSSPEVALKRIQQRGRKEECTIDLEHLQKLHELHENWLMRRCSHFSVPCHVLVLDADQDKTGIIEEFNSRRHETPCLHDKM